MEDKKTRQQTEEMIVEALKHIYDMVRYANTLSAMGWNMKRWFEKRQKDLSSVS